MCRINKIGLITVVLFLLCFSMIGCNNDTLSTEEVEESEISENISESENPVINGVELIEEESEVLQDYAGNMTAQEQADLEYMIDKVGELTEE